MMTEKEYVMCCEIVKNNREWNLCAYHSNDYNAMIIEWHVDYNKSSTDEINEFERFINLIGEYRDSTRYLCTLIDDDDGEMDCGCIEFHIPDF